MPYFKNKTAFWLLVLLATLYCFYEASGFGDFFIFLSAASDLTRHVNIFETSYVDGYHYYYSVLFAILLKPLCSLPFFWVKFGWLILNMFLYLRMFKLLAECRFLDQLTQKQKDLFLILVFIFSFRFLLDNIHTSQITILILACCVYGLYFVHHNKVIKGSAILALGINIKLLPIVFLPYLFFRGYYKGALLTILFYAFTLALPSLIIGHSYNITLLNGWWGLVNPLHQKHVLDVDERSFHGLSTLLSTLLVKNVPDMYALPLKRNIADVSLKTLASILLIVRLVLVLFTLYFFKGSYFKRTKTELNRYTEISYILLLIPLIFPHQQHYAFLFMVPAFAVVLFSVIQKYPLLEKTTQRVIVTLLILVYLSSNLKLLLGEFNQYYEHYKVLTYSALLLIPLLVWVINNPNRKGLHVS